MITDSANSIAAMIGKQTRLPLGRPIFQPIDKYRAFDFDPKNFKRILPSKAPRIAFLDGGNLAVIKTPSFAVHLGRVYFNCFQGGERIAMEIPNRLEFFVVVTSSGNGDIRYEAKFVPLDERFREYLPDEKDLIFSSYDDTIKTGQERIEIPRIGDVARSFAEWRYAEFVNRELRTGDIFVRDGTLHAPYTNQTEYAERAYQTARKNGVLFCGVSKTSHLYTTTGLPLVAAISRLARENGVQAPWCYENIVEITDPAHKADLSFAKLDKASDYIFRIEILKGQEGQKDRIMSALAENSRDLSFPGYPYGLVDSDKNARVSEDELDALRTVLFSEISKSGDFGVFKDFLAGSEAHEWLNCAV